MALCVFSSHLLYRTSLFHSEITYSTFTMYQELFCLLEIVVNKRDKVLYLTAITC